MSILAKMAKAQQEQRSSGRPQSLLTGDISVQITEIDKKNAKFGWLMKGKVVGGARGVGEEFHFAFGKKEDLQRVIDSQLGPKTKVNAIVRMQDPQAPIGTGTADKPIKIRRMTGMNLDGRSKTFFNSPVRVTMFKSGAYQATFAEMESKTRIDSLAALKERVMADMEEGKGTIFVGAVDGNIITGEAYLGQVKGEGDTYVPEDKEVAYKRFVDRLFDGMDLDDPETVAAIDADMAANETGFSAYSLHNVNIFGKTKSVMVEKLKEGGRPSHVPLDVMFVRSIGDRVAAAKNRMTDRQVEVLTEQFAEWGKEKLSAEELEAFNQGGFSEVSESNMAKFMIFSGIELPERAMGQATSWNSAIERLENSNMSSIRTGWNMGDISIDNHVNAGDDTLPYYYVRTVNAHGGGRNLATPFFPDESTKEANQDYIYGLADRLKAFADDPETHKENAAAAREARKNANAKPDQNAEAGKAADAAPTPDADADVDADADARFADPVPAGAEIDDAAIGDAIEQNMGSFDLDD